MAHVLFDSVSVPRFPSSQDLEVPPSASSLRSALVERRRAKAVRIAPRGKRDLTARERAEQLLDPGTFVEFAPLRSTPGSTGAGVGVLTGCGEVEGRPVVAISHDATVASGAIGAAFAEAVMAAQRFALEHGYPIVYLNDSGGARIHDGILALHGCGGIFALNVEAQQHVPQISVILGPCAGAAAYSPALTDWTIMVREQGHMFLTGPDVVKSATGEDATAEEIGGATMHTAESGVAHLDAADEIEALEQVRRLLRFLPSSTANDSPVLDAVPARRAAVVALPDVVPEKASVGFDMHRVIDAILDEEAPGRERLELMPDHARSVLTVLGHLDGRPVGVVANQPGVRGGILDARCSVKAARFVEFCGRFGVPIITLVDVPGFLPGTVEERRGVITHGAGLLKAYAAAKSPRLTVIVRKAYGGAYIAMGSVSLGAQMSWAWAGAEIAVMGPGGAVGLLNRKDLAAAEDPVALRDELAATYREEVARPYVAAEAGIVQDVILPEETRDVLVRGLSVLDGGRRTRG